MKTAGEETTIPVLTHLQRSVSTLGRMYQNSSSPGAASFLTSDCKTVYTNRHHRQQVGRDRGEANTKVSVWEHTAENAAMSHRRTAAPSAAEWKGRCTLTSQQHRETPLRAGALRGDGKVGLG